MTYKKRFIEAVFRVQPEMDMKPHLYASVAYETHMKRNFDEKQIHPDNNELETTRNDTNLVVSCSFPEADPKWTPNELHCRLE